MEEKKKISVIIPMFNEEDVAVECYNRVTKVMQSIENYTYEIVVVNDGSRDSTLNILFDLASRDEKLKVISFTRNFGHQPAVSCGLKNTSGDAVVIIDADLQDPPEIIPDMVKLWEQGNSIVYGKRRSRSGENAFKLITAKMYYRVINSLSNVAIPKDTGDFRLIDKKVVQTINELPEHNKFLRGLYSWTGYKQIAFEYDRKERFAGKTKYSLAKMFKLAWDGIISFSNKPLRIVRRLGVLSIFIALGVFIYSLVAYFNNWHIEPGWASIMVTTTTFAGIELLSLSMIAEYITRIYDEAKNRPEYVIAEKINFKLKKPQD